MYKPKKFKIILNTNLGIIVLKPNKDIMEVTSIGPRNHAKGTAK